MTKSRFPMMGLQKGFTLIELMIVVGVVAVLAAIVYPTYEDSVRKGRRAEARAALAELMQQQERYMTQYNTYKTFTAADTVPFVKTVGNSSSPTYRLTADTTSCSVADAKFCVRLVATPTGSDPEVGELTLLSTGKKDCTGTARTTNFARCWP